MFGLLIAFFELLERGFDVVAPGRPLVAAPGARRFRLGNACHALRGLTLSGQDRVNENPRDATDPEGSQKEYCDRFHSVSGLGVQLLADVGRVERPSQAVLLAVVACAVPKPRPTNPGGMVATENLALAVLAYHVEHE
jgi:hypothetical protein